MRPPEHWHIRPKKRPVRVWWALGVAAALVVAAVVLVRILPSGDEPTPGASKGCAGVECVTPEGAPPLAGDAQPPKITGQAAAVIEQSCGALLYGKNAHERLAPASLVKIATALVAAESADLDELVDVRVNSALLVASTASTVMGLVPGQQMSLRDLLYGLLLPSGNDAAIAVADHLGGGVPWFVEMMNQKAAQLGLENTHFTNPHGLDEPSLYASAYDAALLGRELLAQPELANIVQTLTYQPAWDGPPVWNGNELLTLYPEAVGVKIGYTEQAGQTIVAAAERDGREIIVSVLGAWDRYFDAIVLFEWAFEETAPTCER